MFKKVVEDFVCDNCGEFVVGDGYTNHCPKCLWSKHVDIEPGDRAENCFGKMKPVSVEKEGEEYILTHQCELCDYQKRNKSHPNDNFDVLVKVSSLKA